jgi:hypothetical protein
MLSEPIRVTLQIIEVFDRLNIPYLVGGSMASAVHGVIRSTMDVDIVADIRLDQVDEIAEQLNGIFYIDKEMIRDAIQRKSSFNLIHLDTMFKVDVFLLKQRPFDQNQMRRRVLQLIGENQSEKAYISSAEDIILAKLEWYREGGETSERQWRDILGVLSLQGNQIKLDDLRYWAKNLRVDYLLERALREVGIT